MSQSIQAEFKENKLLQVLECVMGNKVLKSGKNKQKQDPVLLFMDYTIPLKDFWRTHSIA